MKNNVLLFYEHEKKFSRRLRGAKLFTYLYDFFVKHRWFKGNKYTVEEENNSLFFIKHEEEKDES